MQRQKSFFNSNEIGSSLKDNMFNLKQKNKKNIVGSEDFSEKNGKIKGVSKNLGFLDRVIEIIIYVTVFLMPIFVLSFNVSIELGKYSYFAFSSGLLLLAWAVNGIFVKKQLVISKSKLTIIFSILTLSLCLSAFLGVDKYVSLFGSYGTFSDSLVFYASMFIFYFVVNSFTAGKNSERIVRNITKSLIASSFLVVLAFTIEIINPLPLSGVGDHLNLIGGDFAIFAIYLILIIFISFYDLVSYARHSALEKVLDIILIILSVISLVLIGWSFSWFILAILFFVLFAIEKFFKPEEKRMYGALPFVLFVFSFSLIFSLTSVNLGSIKEGKIVYKTSSISLFLQEKLNRSESYFYDSKISKEILMGSVESNPVFGSGPGTYSYDLSRFKSADYNYEDGWNLRTKKAYNEFVERIVTTGILGFLSYILLIFFVIYTAFKLISKDNRFIFVFSAFFAILLFQFVYIDSSVIKFIFVLLLIILSGKDKTNQNILLDFEDKKNLSMILGSFLVGISLFLSYNAIQSYRAEALYSKLTKTEDIVDIEEGDLEKVCSINPYMSEYQSGVSLIYLMKINRLFVSGLDSQENLEGIKNFSDKAINHAKTAVELSPNSVSSWENYAFVYKRIYELGMEGADDWAIKGFEKATELDPENPILVVQLGKMYLTKYQNNNQSEYLLKAEEQFKKAIELKGDYPEGLVELANVYMTKKDLGGVDETSKALESLDKAIIQEDLSIETALKIAKIYYNLGEKDKSLEVLNAIINVNPMNSDAHYIAGIIYKEQQKYTQALNEFNIVLSYNPGNEDVELKISEVEKSISEIGDSNVNVEEESFNEETFILDDEAISTEGENEVYEQLDLE